MAYLSLLVFVSGGAVLAIEIVGTRVLGPFYGVSLYLWSALITVTLAALSLGYAAGGRWADRGPTLTRLATAVGGAGLFTLCIPLLKRPVLLAAEPFGLRVAVLVAAFLLFAPPLTLLGRSVRTPSVCGRPAWESWGALREISSRYRHSEACWRLC